MKVDNDQFSVILDVMDENILVSVCVCVCVCVCVMEMQLLFFQIKDDFLGRHILHFNFNDSNPATLPRVVSMKCPVPKLT